MLPPGARVAPGDVPTLARECGVRPDLPPAVAELDVSAGRGEGWIATTAGVAPLDVDLPEPWPPGRLEIVGGLLREAPTSGEWPPILDLGDGLIVVAMAELVIRSGRALARAHWRPAPAGRWELHASVELATGLPRWTDTDYRTAGKALRWLETLPRPGSGQPPEYDDPGDPRLLQRLADAIHEVVRGGESMSYASIARNVGRDWRTAQKWMDNCPWDLKAIEHEARGCTATPQLHTCRFHVRHAAKYARKGV